VCFHTLLALKPKKSDPSISLSQSDPDLGRSSERDCHMFHYCREPAAVQWRQSLLVPSRTKQITMESNILLLVVVVLEPRRQIEANLVNEESF